MVKCGRVGRCQEGAWKDESSREIGINQKLVSFSHPNLHIENALIEPFYTQTHTPLVEKGTECHDGSLPIALLRPATAEHAEH